MHRWLVLTIAAIPLMYLVLLSKYEGHAAASRFVDRLITNAYTYERDPAKLYEVRREISQELSKH